MPIYAAHGVSHVWLVDPGIQTLEVLAIDGATYRLLQVAHRQQVVRAQPFDAIELKLEALWARQRQAR